MSKSPHIWCSQMDQWLSPLSFRHVQVSRHLWKMLILLLAVLLSWMVSLPSKIMPLSIGPFPNRFPVGPYPPLHDPAFLQPKSFSDIWDLSDSLSSFVALSFQWVPNHAGLPRNEWADSLAKTGTTLLITHVPCPLAPTIAKIRHTRYSLWRRPLAPTIAKIRYTRYSLWRRPLAPTISCPLTYAG